MWLLKGLIGQQQQSTEGEDGDAHCGSEDEKELSEKKFAGDDKQNDDRTGNEKKMALLSGALYKVNGLEFECIFQRCELEVIETGTATASLVAWEIVDNNDEEDGDSPNDENRPAAAVEGKLGRDFEFPLHTVVNFQQHLADGFQFSLRKKKDHSDEFGLQLDSERMAVVLRKIVDPYLSATAAVLTRVPGAFAWYDTHGRTFVPICQKAVCMIAQRPSDFESFLIIREDLEGDRGALLFQDTLSPAMNLWTVPNVSQVVFWGPATQGEGVEPGERRMFMLELLLPEEDPKNIEFFQLLALVLRERTEASRLSAAQRRALEQDVAGRITSKRERRKEREESERFDYEQEDQDMLDFDDLHGGDDDAFDTSARDAEDGMMQWRSNEQSERDASGDEDEEEITPVARDPSRKMSRNDPSALLHKFMEVGSDRTFVCRGTEGRGLGRVGGGRDAIEVQLYKPTGDSRAPLATTGTIKTEKFNYDGRAVKPLKGSLHDNETKLLMTSESNASEVFMMDLEREQIVHKWDADHQPVHNMMPTFKFGQASHDPTFFCHNDSALFLMDTRLKDTGRTTTKNYLSNTQFTTAATDVGGHLLVGSRLGALRLYDGEANAKGEYKRAKTALETIREPITAVDVTCDGAWIVGTTKTYLVVFPTRLASSGRTGFEVALGKFKPAPRYLRLKAADLQKHNLTDIDFSPAKFSGDESCIISSTGNLAVIWDLRSIQKGKPTYTIKKAANFIKDVRTPADESAVVVAFPQDVGLFGTARR